MADSIQFRRGLRSTVKPLPVGMPGFVEDEERLVIGKGDGTNAELPNKADMDNVNSQMAENMQQISQANTMIDNLTNSSVANALRKLLQGQIINVALLGDSLLDGAGGTPIWRMLLFDESQRNAGHSLLADFNLSTDGIKVDNYAVGGTTPDLMLAHLIPQAQSTKGDFGGGQVSFPLYTNPPAITKQYDLAIVDGGTNGGLYTGLMIEEIVRRFMEAGTEVILVSAQRTRWSSTPPIFQEDFHKIAQHYGCKLIDMDEIYQVAGDNVANNTYYADGIHQTTLGHQIWADTFRSFLNPSMADTVGKSTTGILPSTRLFYFSEANRLAQSNYSCYFVNAPSEHNGTREDPVNALCNPLIGQGNLQDTLLTSGQYAEFGLDDAIFIIPVFGGKGASASIDIYPNGASVKQATINVMAGSSGYTPAWTVNTVNYSIINAGRKDYASDRLFKLVCTSNSIQLLGIIVFSEPNIRLKNSGDTLPKGVTNIGTWTRLANWLGKTDIFYTNTLEDTVTVDFIGSSVKTMIGFNKGGGQIEISIDGTVIETKDTYVNTEMAFQTLKYNAIGYGKHTLQLKYVSDNSSSVDSIDGSYPLARLVYKEFQIIDGRQSQTERYSLLKYWKSLVE